MYPAVASHPNFAGIIMVPRCKGVVRQYNGSVCGMPDGSTKFAWRREYQDGHSDIAIGDLLYDAGVKKATQIPFAAGKEDHWMEDPRLFLAGDHLYLLYALVNTKKWAVQQRCRDLTTGIDYPLSNEDDVQKNWTPVDHLGEAAFLDYPAGLVLHGIAPHISAARPGVPLDFPFGTLSGGSPLIPFDDDHVIGIYHGHMPHESRTRRYFFGAYLVEKYTFTITHISARPLVYASDEDPAIPCPRTAAYNPCAIFPCGIMQTTDGRWLVSAGMQDSHNALFRFATADLNLVPVGTPLEARLIAKPGMTGPSGSVAVRTLCPLFEDGHHYEAGEEFFLSAARAAALPTLVSIL